jgi:hypothetical protein
VSSRILPLSFLKWRRYRYLKAACLLASLGIVAHRLDAEKVRGGDTVLGYVLGGVAGGLMIWLALFGIRKRRYRAWRTPLVEWLSAHVYLGLAVPVLAALHCNFAFHWNVHGLTYALMLLAVVSGVVGAVFYREIPRTMTRDHPDERLRDLLAELPAIDRECEVLAVGGNLPDAFLGKVMAALEVARTPPASSAEPRKSLPKVKQVTTCARAIRTIQDAAIEEKNEPRDVANRLLVNLKRKEALLKRLRQEIRHRALLEVWLVFHVPLAIASLAALAVHIFVVLAV